MNHRVSTRIAGILALLAASCGPPPEPVSSSSGPALTATPPVETPATAASTTAPAADQTPAAPLAEPDVPAGADATRDAELTAVAANIFDAFFNIAPRLTPDGKTVIFRSNRDGIPQLYAADAAKPDAPATRITQLKERVGDIEITPDGKTILFVSDKGADENFSIFRIGVDGSGLAELTKGETLHRDEPIVPTGTPTTMVYTAHQVKEKASRLYMQAITEGSPPKLVYTDPAPSFLTDVSSDGQWALLLRLNSLSDSKILLVDLKTGAAKPVHPAAGKTEYATMAAFSADGSTIFISTDAGGETGTLLALDAKTLAEKARYVETKPATARIASFAVAEKGDRIALFVDAGNRSEIRLLDAKTLKPTAGVAMPLGTGGGLTFSDDGATLTAHWSTPGAPPDLYAIDVKTGKSRALRKEPRPTLAKLPAIDATITEVASFDKTKIPVNLYLPKPLPKGKKLPVLVVVHGGPASSYAVRWSAFTRFYSSNGFAIVEPNVRGSTGFGRAYEQADNGPKRMDAVKDVEEVGKWASTQPWADASKLVIFGGSYGGYMTLMGVSHHPTLWKAGVDIFGVYSWRTFMTSTSGVIRELFQKEIGPESDTSFLDSISPKSSVDKIGVPLFVYSGQNDPRVPRSESDQIVASLRGRKVPVEYMVAMNEGHSLDRKENITAFLGRSMRFLETKLLKTAAPATPEAAPKAATPPATPKAATPPVTPKAGK